MDIQLTILIPVYNEINLIQKFSNNLINTFKNTPTKYVFIDDGSTDGTSQWLKENLKVIYNDYQFELLSLNKNYGKGYAIRQGIKTIESAYTLCIDSDLEYNPKDALEIYTIIKNNNNIDVLYGSRYLGGKIRYRKHFLNDIAVRLNTYIFNILFDQSITDLHTGTKVIKTSLLKDLQLTLNRFGLEIDMSSQIAKRNYNIYEYGISYVERTKDQGKKITFIDGLLSYFFLFKMRFLQNDLPTLISITYSVIFMFYLGTLIGGLGIINFIICLFCMAIGLMLGINRKLIPLSFMFLTIYLTILFFPENIKIFSIFITFILSFSISRKISNKFKFHKKSFFLKYLI